jgi:hypothetical protein
VKRNSKTQAQPRRDTIKAHLIAEHRHDPYKARGKLAEPSVCSQCASVFAKGRWQRVQVRPEGAELVICPACQRINDAYPAGEIVLSGTFVAVHAKELIALARNTEAKETSEHPLQRIMSVEQAGGRIVITTTDIHLPRRIAHAIEAAYKGDLETHYDEAGYFVRIEWRRD